MSYFLKLIKGDCNICAKDEIDLISPNKYDEIECNHFICEECWKNIGRINPICPMCQRDVSSWMVKFMKFEISTEIGYDPFIQFEEFIENNDGRETFHNPFIHQNSGNMSTARYALISFLEVEEPDSENLLDSNQVIQIIGNDTFYVRNEIDRRINHLTFDFNVLNRVSNMISEHLINNIIEMIDAQIFRSMRDTENRNEIQGIINAENNNVSNENSQNLSVFLPLNEKRNGISHNKIIFLEIKKASAFFKGSQSKKNKVSEKYKEKNKKNFPKNNKKRYNYKTNIHSWR